MAVNYDDVLAEMRAHGLRVDALELDSGKTVRCFVEGEREKRGWYRLSRVHLGDREYLIGAYGVWRGTDKGKVAVKPGRNIELTREERVAIAARLRADNAKAKAQRAAEAERAARTATRVWRRYVSAGESSYLGRKGVGAHGVRFHPTADTIAVPLMDASGKVWGLELIRGADRGNRLAKQFFPRGVDPVGRYHLLGTSPRDLVLIAEGYATAASLHEATGLAVACAFSAGNLLPVAQALRKQYPAARILVCADDDCATWGNPGKSSALAASIAVEGGTVAPDFSSDERQAALRARIDRIEATSREEFKPKVGLVLQSAGTAIATDFNDLHQIAGLAEVRAQIEARLRGVGWLPGAVAPRASVTEGGGAAPMVARLSVDDAVQRYWGTYGMGGKALFDEVERRIVHKDDVLNLLPRHGWEQMRDHPGWRVARDWEIGFDPSGTDETIRCNLFGGWPTVPRPGRCERLLELLEYLCSNEPNPGELYNWLLDWLAFPLQRPGAKMHSAVVVHGPQGTGKSLFFEAYMQIYGEYGRLLGQEALEDKFNADWAEKKLFILADEVLARTDMYHIKNRLKGFITGGTIRVNPKNVAAHNERNCMNIVFLSNERMPLVLEDDDRRHCVFWVPPKLADGFYDQVTEEIDAGGAAALHHFLLQRDISHFRVSARPPKTRSWHELVQQSISSEVRFIREWQALDVDAADGRPLPFCPCASADLYTAYKRWCERHGERARRAQELIGHVAKLPGWSAGDRECTWNNWQDRSTVRRRMVIPPATAIEQSIRQDDSQEQPQQRYRAESWASRTEWLSAGYLDFRNAVTALDH